MSSEWWHNVKHPDIDTVTIGELVDGLDEVADQAIAYGRITRRAHTVYSAEFRRWGDLAGETVASLLRRPRGGLGTVRALVTAAREAVAFHRSDTSGEHVDAATAVQRLIDRLRERDRVMLSAMVWALHPQSQSQVAARLGIHTASVQRNLPRAVERFSELLADPAHRAVVDYASQLRGALGPFVPVESVSAEVRRMALEWPSPEAELLLHVAGPYAWRGAWLEHSGGAASAAAAVDELLTECAAPTTDLALERLAATGMPRHIAEAYLTSREDLRRHGDRWVRRGQSAADQAEAFLHLHGQPAAIDDIIDGVGADYSARSVREAIYADKRFVRTSRRAWALAHWETEQYRGIFEAIVDRIDAAGGAVGADALVSDVCAAFPDVADLSIRRFLMAPAFVVESGSVRHRRASDPWPAAAPLNTARGAFRNGANEVRVALPVTEEMLRGSGRALPAGVAAVLGLRPGQRHAYTGPQGAVTVGWRMSSHTGPHIGSVRALALSVGATLGDTLVLALDAENRQVAATRLPAGQRGPSRLRALLGRRAHDPLTALARSLDCHPPQVADVLAKRGDHYVLEDLGHDRDAGSPIPGGR